MPSVTIHQGVHLHCRTLAMQDGRPIGLYNIHAIVYTLLALHLAINGTEWVVCPPVAASAAAVSYQDCCGIEAPCRHRRSTSETTEERQSVVQ